LVKYSAVLFDFDDTLVNTAPGKAEAFRRVAQLLRSEGDGSVSVEELVDEISKISEDMNRRRQYSRDVWWRILAQKKGINISRHLELRATVAYWASFKRNTQLYQDTLKVLDKIRSLGIPIGLVTDTDGWVGIKRWRLSSSPIFEYFDAVVVAGEDTRGTKPDPKPFQLCTQRLGVSPRNTVFVGDKPYTDIVGAKSVGMTAVLVKRRTWGDVMGADYVVDSLSDFLELLS